MNQFFFFLVFPQFAKNEAVPSQFFERPFFHYPAVLQYIYPVKIAEQVKTVKTGDDGLITEFIKYPAK